MLAKARAVKMTERLHFLGKNAGDDFVYNLAPDCTGRESDDDTHYFEGEPCEVGPGLSGGALMTEDWLLLGMIRKGQKKTNYAVRIERVINKLKAWRYSVRLVERVEVARPPPPSPPPPPPPPPPPSHVWVGWALASVGAAALVSAGVVWLVSNDRFDGLQSSCDRGCTTDYRSVQMADIQRLDKWSLSLAIGGAVMVAGGGIVSAVMRPKAESTTGRLVFDPRNRVLGVGGRF
jgi:hypothetical protein